MTLVMLRNTESASLSCSLLISSSTASSRLCSKAGGNFTRNEVIHPQYDIIMNNTVWYRLNAGEIWP